MPTTHTSRRPVTTATPRSFQLQTSWILQSSVRVEHASPLSQRSSLLKYDGTAHVPTDIFLIRNPEKSAPSWWRLVQPGQPTGWTGFNPEELGMPMLKELYDCESQVRAALSPQQERQR